MDEVKRICIRSVYCIHGFKDYLLQSHFYLLFLRPKSVGAYSVKWLFMFGGVQYRIIVLELFTET